MTATLVATTTRPVTFDLMTDYANRAQTWPTREFPAGTKVYATECRDGRFIIRIPGTLWETSVSAVYAATLIPS